MNQTDVDVLKKLQADINSCKLCSGRNINCSCYKKYFYNYSVISAHIPVKYRAFTLKDFDSLTLKKSVGRINKYIETLDKNRKAGTGLYLWGTSGSGKTSLGCVVLMEAIKHGYTCRFCSVDEYRKSLFPEEADTFAQIRNVQFLMIDDIGREFQDGKGFIVSYLDDLLRYRTDNLTPTIITSNNDSSMATDSFRFESIIKEHFLLLEFNVVDHRKKIQESLKHENA